MCTTTPLPSRPSARIESQRLDRRVVLRAGAALAAFAAAGTTPFRPAQVAAQSAPSTVAFDWYEAVPGDVFSAAALPTDEGFTVAPGFAFTAVGAHWDGTAGTTPVVELRISDDGETFSEPYWLPVSIDEGRPTRDGRYFTNLVFANGAQAVHYRVIDGDGAPFVAPGFALTFIDSSTPPASAGAGGNFDLQLDSSTRSSPPTIISRADWGANETYRYSDGDEIWPPTYSTVEHVIIHHTATAGDGDPAAEIRSIYYYHAITKGWGDIAYNYLVDRFGTIYEGRVGGQDVVGGHSYQYQDGSSGIALLGTYMFDDLPQAGQAAIIAIVAWVARDLDPYGSSDFWAIPDLPTICGHRDVDPSTECPGDVLYDDLGTIRDYVAAAIAESSDVPPAGLVVGDDVVIATDDGGPLNVRDVPGLHGEIRAVLPDGTQVMILEGPVRADGYSWYRLEAARATGWAVADFLFRVVPDGESVGRFAVGDTVAVAIDGGNLRNGPGLDFSVAYELPLGTPGLVIVGPHVVDGYIWYQLDTPTDIGWMADSILAPANEVSPPVGAPTIGDTVTVATDWLNLREGPGTSYSVVTAIPERTTGTVNQGPRSADGYAWYRLKTALGTGWAAAEFLSLGSRSSRSVQVGATAVVSTDALNIRVDPSLGSDVVGVIFQGDALDVIDGPVRANGATWWHVDSAQVGSGWCVGGYIRAS